MPTTMIQLAIVQFFSWVALFSMWVYTTPSIADTVFHTSDPQSAAYQEGGNWVGVGIAWASVLTMPYAILAGALPANRMGYYMGLFNFFVVIPQIIAGVVLGAVLKNFFNNQSVKVLMLGGVCMVIGGLLTMIVKDDAVAKH